MRTIITIMTVISVLSATQICAAEWDIIHAGKLLAVPGENVAELQSIILKNGKVVDVKQGYIEADTLETGENDTVDIHDLTDKFVLPGFIDGHVHLTLFFQPNERINWVNMSD
ncbi:MAG: hypothetical protein AAGJ37_16425, partial [Pseudomonadota bacterium]